MNTFLDRNLEFFSEANITQIREKLSIKPKNNPEIIASKMKANEIKIMIKPYTDEINSTSPIKEPQKVLSKEPQKVLSNDPQKFL